MICVPCFSVEYVPIMAVRMRQSLGRGFQGGNRGEI